MRLILLVACYLLLTAGCVTANYALNYDDTVKPPRADIHRVVVIGEGGYTSKFLREFTPYIAAAFTYRGYNCTGIYFDSTSFEHAADVTRRADSLKPDITVQLYAVADILTPTKYGEYHSGNIYRLDVMRGYGEGKKLLAKGTAAIDSENQASPAGFRKIATQLCVELLKNGVEWNKPG